MVRLPTFRSLALLVALALSAVLGTLPHAYAEEAKTTLSGWIDGVSTYATDSTFGTNGDTTTSVDIAGLVTASLSAPMFILDYGTVWETWTNEVTPVQVLYTRLKTLTITLSEPVQAFGFFLEPNPFQDILFTITAGGTSTELMLNGNGGAGFWGWIGDVGETISSITISTTSTFAISNFYYSASVRGTPIDVPGPIAGAGVPAVLGILGYALLRWRRTRA